MLGEENPSVFSEEEKLSLVIHPYGLAVSQKILTFLDVNVEFETVPCPSIATASLKKSNRQNFCLYCQVVLSTCFAFSCILYVL